MQDPNQNPNPEPTPGPLQPSDTPAPTPTPETIDAPKPAPLGAEPAWSNPQLPGATYYPVVRQTNTLAVVSLVSSILAWLGLFGIGGIIGIITGSIARREIRASNGQQDGDGIALTGIILGGVNVVLTCLALLCLLAFFVAIPAMGIAMDGFK